VPLIALIFDEELLDNVPAEPHDRRVDVIITPSRTINVV
jgi:5-formyltetrahydrofolate cyclo-ligase